LQVKDGEGRDWINRTWSNEDIIMSRWSNEQREDGQILRSSVYECFEGVVED
jgi:hypothetical protein